MEHLAEFLSKNVGTASKEHAEDAYKDGISDTDLLERAERESDCPVTAARAAYARNLASKEFRPFHVPDSLSRMEQCLMYLSFNEFDLAVKVLMIPVQLEFIGAKCRGRTGGTYTAEVAHAVHVRNNTISFPFSISSLSFEDYHVSPLDTDELLFLAVKLKELDAKEDNETIRIGRMKAIIHRALFERNNLTDSFRLFFLLELAKITRQTSALEKFLEDSSTRTGSLFETFEHPVVFARDVLLTLGTVYLERKDYRKAYEFFSALPFVEQRISCLIGLRERSDAEQLIESELSRLSEATDRGSMSYKARLYIHLAEIRQEPRYYDDAAAAFPSVRPFILKGKYFWSKADYASAASSYEQGLSLAPENFELLFAYGCVLVELDEISKALPVFRKLKDMDSRNLAVVKNLSYCYYKLDEIKASLENMKLAALEDPSVLQSFLLISIKHGIAENVSWAMTRIQDTSVSCEAAWYLVSTGKMTEAELRKCLEKNPYFSSLRVNEVMSNIIK